MLKAWFLLDSKLHSLFLSLRIQVSRSWSCLNSRRTGQSPFGPLPWSRGSTQHDCFFFSPHLLRQQTNMSPSNLPWISALEDAAEQFDGGPRSFPLASESSIAHRLEYDPPNEDYQKLF
jgi:hypothetical protein